MRNNAELLAARPEWSSFSFKKRKKRERRTDKAAINIEFNLHHPKNQNN